jgi:hypothetical protein
MNPIATVALPLWNMGGIAWLAIESLCRQKTEYPWELIILQESADIEHNYFSLSADDQERLKAAGCCRIEVKEYSERVPLLQKWADAGELASDFSVAFLLHAGDCYSDPNRITESVKAIDSGHDWAHQASGMFYRTTDGATVKYNGNTKAYFTHLNMAFKTEYARTIPVSDITSKIDGYLFLYIKDMVRDFRVGFIPDSLASLDTHGHNQISVNRGAFFDNPKAPFVETTYKLEDTKLPTEIIQRLQTLIIPMTPSEIVLARIDKMIRAKKLHVSAYSDGYMAAMNELKQNLSENPLPDPMQGKLVGRSRSLSERKNVIAVIPVHGRGPLVAKTIERLLKVNGCSQVICSGQGEEDKKVCEDAGAIWVEHPNSPLGKKWNAAFLKAKEFSPDACLFMGSSDWISENWLAEILPHLDTHAMVGPIGCYFGDFRDGKTRLVDWPGYAKGSKDRPSDPRRLNEPIGIGRVLSSEYLDAVGWTPIDDHLDSSIDWSMYMRVFQAGFTVGLYNGPAKAMSISCDLWDNKHQFEEHWNGKFPSSVIEKPDLVLSALFADIYDVFNNNSI